MTILEKYNRYLTEPTLSDEMREELLHMSNEEINDAFYRELEFGTAFKDRQHYDGKMPFFISEYGGIGWNVEGGWGYGNAPKTEEEFLQRLEGLTDALLENKNIFGLCYTQLTDVEQEQNGLYTYDRRPKFPPEQIHKIFSKKAAIED